MGDNLIWRISNVSIVSVIGFGEIFFSEELKTSCQSCLFEPFPYLWGYFWGFAENFFFLEFFD